MKNYTINALQFQLIPSVLHVTQATLRKKLDVTSNYMSRHLRDGDFKISEVINLCNIYHIRMSHFVCVGESTIARADFVTPSCEWTDIEFSQKAIRKIMKDKSITYAKIMDVMECSRSFIDGLFSPDVPLKKFLSFCNAFGINISDIVSDPTLPRITTSSQDIKQENENLRKEVDELRNELFRLKQLVYKRNYNIDVPELSHVAESTE